MVTEDYDGVVFFSPSAVESFISVNAVRKEATLFAVGQFTAASLRSFANEVIVSPTPDPILYIDHIIDYYNKKHDKNKY